MIPWRDPMSTPTGTASPSSPMSLHDVTSPQVLRELAPGELPAPAGQIRAFLIAKVSATGGRLGPNLGVVEQPLVPGVDPSIRA
ncbi:1-deoxy-D-xylulose-5-phosphate synthase N-terminal domain-containing protein [Streptomyces sp. NPDC020379]|uniref:1-deoxy-D-xylulose-5-phosphate synthase N-terminal domain-containing protein n=1 Tax=Streptomyces sp. NPDC020379 TaxID=3365071 RepID=UPI0037B88A8E